MSPEPGRPPARLPVSQGVGLASVPLSPQRPHPVPPSRLVRGPPAGRTLPSPAPVKPHSHPHPDSVHCHLPRRVSSAVSAPTLRPRRDPQACPGQTHSPAWGTPQAVGDKWASVAPWQIPHRGPLPVVPLPTQHHLPNPTCMSERGHDIIQMVAYSQSWAKETAVRVPPARRDRRGQRVTRGVRAASLPVPMAYRHRSGLG